LEAVAALLDFLTDDLNFGTVPWSDQSRILLGSALTVDGRRRSRGTPHKGVQTETTDDPREFGRQRPAGATARLTEETGDNGRWL
jgi:hypothetical protein